ncbi:MAG: RNA-binding cell elongation regulator Jag/EloR [Thermacetogeniaceae bacterium]|jgi:spoIIIJ-associated protein|nr:KH domain-containing protein [Syntrophomonadaceae bacterium]
MREIVTEGSTVDDAVKIALEKLQVSHDQVEIDVLESGSRGFLGLIGGKQAKVRVTVKESPKEIITKFISDVIKALEFDADFNIYYQDGYWRVDFEGEDVRFLIGRKGKTLNSLQMLANLSVNNKLEEKVKIIIDAEGYRERREESLRRLARKTAERVCRTKKDIMLEPMTPQERRIIHLELQNSDTVTTTSRGDEPYRKVVVCYKPGDA